MKMSCFLKFFLVIVAANYNVLLAQGKENGIAARKQLDVGSIQSVSQPQPDGCNCQHYSCECCAHLDVPVVHLDETGCVNVSYLPVALGLRLEVTLNGKSIFKEEVSVKNPPPLCFGIPHIKKYASICVVFYNLTWRKHIGGCLKLEVRLYGVIEKDFNIGCFNFNNMDSLSKLIVSRLFFELNRINEERRRLEGYTKPKDLITV